MKRSSRTRGKSEERSQRVIVAQKSRSVLLDVLAAQLLREQLVLTALELHTELLETGREQPRLRDYFSNPGHFERQSGCTPPGAGPGGSLVPAGGAREAVHSAGAAGGGSLRRAARQGLCSTSRKSS
ncbi:hypothetical protein NDU88_000610 [Pleurodeles waltl]|uniref:Uncharacterized protein n=1 Tax=Pleurodeles waltl TaxID=8319 RepID=A0AAV7SA46_PLEWA|nr:hypothetical protein NDU88_000610 [Pleurodeles waltl]